MIPSLGYALLFWSLGYSSTHAAESDRWVPVLESIVVSVPDQDTFKISQDPKKPWNLKDQLCISRNESEVACGDVVFTTPEYAVIRVLSIVPIKKMSAHPKPVKTKVTSQKEAAIWKDATQSPLPKAEEKVEAAPVATEPSPSASVPQSAPQPGPLASTKAIVASPPVVSSVSVPTEESSGFIEARLFPVLFRKKLGKATFAFIDGTKAVPKVGGRVVVKKGGISLLLGTVAGYCSETGTFSVRTGEMHVADHSWVEGAVYTVLEIANQGITTGRIGLKYVVGLGFPFDSYKETGHSDYFGVGLQPKLELQYRFDEAWEARASGFLTAFALAKNQSQTLRILGAHLEGGYGVSLSYRFKLTLLAAGFYRTMLVSNNVFGVTHLGGAGFSPRLDYTASHKIALSLFARFLPVLNAAPITFSNRELALGLSGQYLFLSGDTIIGTLEYSGLNFVSSPLESSLSTVLIGFGYTW